MTQFPFTPHYVFSPRIKTNDKTNVKTNDRKNFLKQMMVSAYLEITVSETSFRLVE